MTLICLNKKTIIATHVPTLKMKVGNLGILEYFVKRLMKLLASSRTRHIIYEENKKLKLF